MRLKVLTAALAVAFAAGHANAAERQDVATTAAAADFSARAARLGFDQVSYGADGRVNAIFTPAGGSSKNVALKSRITEQRASGADEVAALFQRDLGTLVGLLADNAVRVNDVNVAAEGRVYYRGDQTYKGLTVWGGGLTVQTDAAGKVEAVLGSTIGVQNLDVVPRTDARAALTGASLEALQASGDVGPARRVPVPKIASEPELVVYAAAGHEPTLAWAARVKAGELDSRVFADAQTGALLNHYTNKHDLLNRRIYDGKSQCIYQEGMRSIGESLTQYPDPPALVEGGNVAAADASVQRAYRTIGQAYYFVLNALGRDSYDNAGSRITGIVRYAEKAKKADRCSTTFNNAFWTSDDKDGAMAFGSGGSLGDLTASPDVAYHEMGHGVTFGTSGLAYQYESGGINESNSDVIAAATEAWMNTVTGEPDASTPIAYQPTSTTWQIGEKMASGVLRTMNDPAAAGKGDFDYYQQYVDKYGSCTNPGKTTNDYCGVHTSSGIGNLAFYLLVNGGSHPRNKSTVYVSKLPMERAVRYLYEANLLVLGKNATFSDMRNAEQARARANGNLCDEIQVSNAWAAVGVNGVAPQDATACASQTQAPVAAFAQSLSGRTLSVDGSASTDPDGSVVKYTWDFGDGTSGTGAKTTRQYAANGNYTVKLTVTDNYGVTNTVTQAVTVLTMADSQCKGPVTVDSIAAVNETKYSAPYTTTGYSSHVACVEGPAGSDFRLYLDQQNGSTWKQVAASSGTATAKRLSSSQGAGTYRVRVVSNKGTGQYYFSVAKP